MATLQSEIAAAQAKLIPKKKFAFKSRKKKAAAAAATPAEEGNATSDAGSAGASAGASAAAAAATATRSATESSAGVSAVDLTAISESGAEKAGFSNLADQTLVLTALDVVGKDLEIKNLRNCKVYIRGQPNILHVKNLTDCQVCIG